MILFILISKIADAVFFMVNFIHDQLFSFTDSVNPIVTLCNKSSYSYFPFKFQRKFTID
jgi:hypothetical protein